MLMPTPSSPVIYLSTDTPDIDTALEYAALCKDTGQGIKIGLEFFNANGPQGVSKIREAHANLPIFLDLKYHDIPNTVGAAVREAAKLGVNYLNVHATGGEEMMKRALAGTREGAQAAGVDTPKLLAVTLLTSLDLDDMKDIGLSGGPVELVTRLARLAHECGLDGAVCSPIEIAPLRRDLSTDFALMVPGIRPTGSAAGDQKRVMTPKEALHDGATHLVIGRPVTAAKDPEKALRDILDSIED
jgi:orotidine-5'-phosphate decarboxylase